MYGFEDLTPEEIREYDEWLEQTAIHNAYLQHRQAMQKLFRPTTRAVILIQEITMTQVEFDALIKELNDDLPF